MPFGIFATLFQAVLTSGLTLFDVEALVKASMTLVQLLTAGKYGDAITAFRTELTTELPILEKAARAIFPSLHLDRAVDLLAQLLTGSHEMTAEAEQAAIGKGAA